MKKKIIGLTAVFIVMFMMSMLAACGSIGSGNYRWEYTFIERSSRWEDMTIEANRLGEEGWELVTASQGMQPARVRMVFKRRLP